MIRPLARFEGWVSSRTWHAPVQALLVSLLAFSNGCDSSRSLEPYAPLNGLPDDLIQLENTAAVVVGTLSQSPDVQEPRPSPWDKRPVQLARIQVKVETVLKLAAYAKSSFQREQDKAKGELPVYYFLYPTIGDLSPTGVMEMAGKGGRWHLGDRLMFFLQSDNGKFRTTCDHSHVCVPFVYSGAHASYPSGTDLSSSIIDIFLTRGQGASDQQMLLAIETFRLYDLNAAYAIKALRRLANDASPSVREAASQQVKSQLSQFCEGRWQTAVPWVEACNQYQQEKKLQSPSR